MEGKTTTLRNKKRRMKQNRTSFAVRILFLSPLFHSRIHAVPDYSCNVMEDICPTKFNDICERSSNAACSSGDCFDCDQCRQFTADCGRCIEHGCYYCPGDGTCFNSPHYVMTNVFSHCTDPSDYLKDACDQGTNFFRDPMYGAQAWVYEMIRVVEVWQQGILGDGVRVRVNDNGVDSSHVEFEGRFDIDGSCDLYDPQELDTSGASHGTTVAGIIGAAANNDECSVGIAPKVTLSSCYVFDGSDYFTIKLDSFDISQNSYGIDGCVERSGRQLQQGTCPFQFVEFDNTFPCNVCDDFNNLSQACEYSIKQHCQRNYESDVDGCLEFLDMILGGNCLYGVLDDREREAIVQGIIQGRNGKGIIYVFASGNAYNRGDDTNIQAYTNSRFLISVGGVGKDRAHASYSTPGASLFVVAPGGDFENIANHVTAAVGGTCQDAGSGTSFACPVVAGVVALMLQVNPELTWRDVQHILAGTSQRVTDLNDDTNVENAAGYWHSNLYGFGIIDAAAAVETAMEWDIVGPEKMLLVESEMLNLPIVDNDSVFLTTSLQLASSSPYFAIESVAVQLDLEHFARGHLEIILKSPQGTQSVLHPGRRPENTQLDTQERWKFLTVRHWGERPEGNWTLFIVDLKEGDAGECASQPWTMSQGIQVVDCNLIDRVGLCLDGVLDPYQQLTEALYNQLFDHQDNGLKATDACCSCGGGITKSAVTDQLRQWTLVVYGSEQENLSRRFGSEVPTLAETEAPTKIPTKDPSPFPSSYPSPNPARTPSQQPTGGPSTEPTVTFSLTPTQRASSQPTPPDSSMPTITISNAPSISLGASFTGNPSMEPIQTSAAPFASTTAPSQHPVNPQTTSPILRPTDATTPSPTSQSSSTPTVVTLLSPTSQPISTPTVVPSSLPTETAVGYPSHGANVSTESPTNAIDAITVNPSSSPSTAPTLVSSDQQQNPGDLSESPQNGPSLRPTNAQSSFPPASFPTQRESPSPTSELESRLASKQKSACNGNLRVPILLLTTALSVVLLLFQ